MENIVNILWNLFKIVGLSFLIIAIVGSLISVLIVEPIKKRRLKNKISDLGKQLEGELDKIINECLEEEINKKKTTKKPSKTKEKKDK